MQNQANLVYSVYFIAKKARNGMPSGAVIMIFLGVKNAKNENQK